MLNYKKMILSTTLAMAIIAPTAVYAVPLNDVKPGSKMSACEKKCAKDNCKMEDKKMTKDCKMAEESKTTEEHKIMQVQKYNKEENVDTYEQTLQKAENFVPGTTEKGETALNNRQELKNELSDIMKEKIEAAILPIKEEFKAEVTKIEDKAINGEITKKAAREQLMIIQHEKIVEAQDIKDKLVNENIDAVDAVKVKKEAVNESYNNFTLAIKSKNAKTIENTFDIYIQNSNELDSVLSQLVNQFTA
jgi:hypothetical protein